MTGRDETQSGRESPARFSGALHCNQEGSIRFPGEELPVN
jgi:hypothetical protein